MSNQVYYHHPKNNQYSLAYVTRDKNEISDRNGDEKIERYELNEEFFVLYTNHGDSGTVDDLDYDFDDVLEDMALGNRVITIRLLGIFEGIIEEKQLEENEPLDIYKRIALDQIPDAISRVDWNVASVDVAGQLMSTLVLKHAFPNANHRTAIGLSEWYLESIESRFSFPEFATEEFAWKDWVDEYIAESKRILTVRRNTKAFSLLQDWGCDTVERKGEVTIDLEEYCLEYSSSESLRKYAERHTELCTEFIIDSVERAGYEELIRSDGATKSNFVEYLREST